MLGSDGQREYNATMKQAVGRALRMGQLENRRVYVYQFFAKKTIDADLLEHRNRGVLRCTGAENGVEIADIFYESAGPGDYSSPAAKDLCRDDKEYA